MNQEGKGRVLPRVWCKQYSTVSSSSSHAVGGFILELLDLHMPDPAPALRHGYEEPFSNLLPGREGAVVMVADDDKAFVDDSWATSAGDPQV
jgi:hypothetical protein